MYVCMYVSEMLDTGDGHVTRHHQKNIFSSYLGIKIFSK